MIWAGGDNDGEAIDLTWGSMEGDVIVHVLGTVVMDDPHMTDLVVNDEQDGIVPVKPLKQVVCGNLVDPSLVSQE